MIRRYLFLVPSSLITLLILGVLLAPRGLAIYYQWQGNRRLNDVLLRASSDDPAPIPCVIEPLTDEEDRKQVEESVSNLQKAVKYSQSSSHAYLLLGRAYCLNGQPEKAVEAYREYTNLLPGNPLGHLELGFALEKINDEASAIREWKTSGVTSNDFLERGEQARLKGFYNDALRWYDFASSLGLTDGDVWYFRGLVYEDKNELENALAAYTKSITYSRSSGVSDIYYRIGNINYKQYNSLEAIDNFKIAIDFDNFTKSTVKADALFRFAVLQEGQGKPAESFINELEEAIKLEPNHSGAHAMLGTAYYQYYHDLNRAISELETALSINPQEKWAYLRLSQIYFAEQDWEKCSATYDRLFDLFSIDQEIQTSLASIKWCNFNVEEK